MNFEILLSPRAQRDLDGLRERIYFRIQAAIDALAMEPRPRNSRKLTSSQEWRIRVSQYRIRYLIDDTARRIVVTRIGHRRDVYNA